MRAVIYLLFRLLTTLAKLIRPGGGRAIVAENLLLKQQLIIHSRSRQRAPNLTTHDRTLLGFLPLFLNLGRIARTAIIIKPSTLRKSHWVMVVMDQYTRRIIGFGVHARNVDGPALCRIFNNATLGQSWPERLSSDNDPLFQYQRWTANLRVLEIDEIKSLPHAHMSHPFVERLIGSVRRELLDHTLFWTTTDLEKKLRDYQAYYKEPQCHLSCEGARARLRLNTTAKKLSISITTDGRNIVADCFSCQWPLEIRICQGQGPHDHEHEHEHVIRFHLKPHSS
jgi:hypothetical protein